MNINKSRLIIKVLYILNQLKSSKRLYMMIFNLNKVIIKIPY